MNIFRHIELGNEHKSDIYSLSEIELSTMSDINGKMILKKGAQERNF